jgi:hypothetical protein
MSFKKPFSHYISRGSGKNIAYKIAVLVLLQLVESAGAISDLPVLRKAGAYGKTFGERRVAVRSNITDRYVSGR